MYTLYNLEVGCCIKLKMSWFLCFCEIVELLSSNFFFPSLKLLLILILFELFDILFDLQFCIMDVPCLKEKNRDFVVSLGTYSRHLRQRAMCGYCRHEIHYAGCYYRDYLVSSELLHIFESVDLLSFRGMGLIESRVDLRERTHRYDMIDIGFIATQDLHDYLSKNQMAHDVKLGFLFLCVTVVFVCRFGRCGTRCSLAAVLCMVCCTRHSTKADQELSFALF